MDPTKTNTALPHRTSAFGNIVGALEYAAQGETGYNFYDSRGRLETVLTYRDLVGEARSLARKLLGLGCQRGDRVCIVAETDPMFHRFFFACQYAGLVPVPVPAAVQMGAREAYVEQLNRMLQSCGASIAVATEAYAGFLREAAQPLNLTMVGAPGEFDALPESDTELVPLAAKEPAYLQYTSGSTRFPRGVEIAQERVLTNLRDIAEHGLKITPEDRMISWLPLYHDMGLVGFVLVPLSNQLSVDYLSPRTFAMRPRLWLKLLSDNRGTITSGPSFGYALCAKRLRWSDCQNYDLSAWRAACVGAERINPEPLRQFTEALAPAGFSENAWVACYGMAECTLAITFAPLNIGLNVDMVDRDLMVSEGKAVPLAADDVTETNALSFVDCGEPLPTYELSIRSETGEELPDRQCGQIWVKGPSIMSGYFKDPESTNEVLSEDGWLDTGDIGYRVGTHLTITARRKDVIIVNGRNIWPEDLEHVAERVPGARLGHVSAFSVTTAQHEEVAVLVVESRETNPAKRKPLIDSIAGAIAQHFGLTIHVDLVPRGTLPRTSSGKLSRQKTKLDFIERRTWDALPVASGGESG